MAASNRIWVIAGTLIIVVVLALAGLLGVLPQLDAAKSSNDETASVEATNAQHRAELAALKEESAQITQITADVAELRKSVAATIDLDSVIADLAAVQAATGVTISNYTSLVPAAFAPSPGVIAQVPATITSSNFLTTELQITVEGPRDAAFAFIKSLQTGSRLYFVSDVSGTGPTTTMLTVTVYTLLETPLVDPAAAATTTTPEAAAAQ